MSSETPDEVINRVKKTLRKEAKLSSYDPEEPSVSNLPSLEQSLSELDPSPPHLRCEKCKASLLRGSKSVVCVICGHNQNQDPPPDPIKFNTTSGYNWFLNYLQLNGSEMVDPSIKLTQSRGRKYVEVEPVPLSDLIDLEIKWPESAERLEAKNSMKIISSNSNVLQDQGDVSVSENVQQSDTDAGLTEDTDAGSTEDTDAGSTED